MVGSLCTPSAATKIVICITEAQDLKKYEKENLHFYFR